MSTRKERIRERIEKCSAGDITAAANVINRLRISGISAEEVARKTLIAALCDDDWLDELRDI